MATSFLQFCATCEEQITIPNNSILYCSERCRRRDSLKPLSISIATTAAIGLSRISTPEPDLSPMSLRAIVAPMVPTKASSSTTSWNGYRSMIPSRIWTTTDGSPSDDHAADAPSHRRLPFSIFLNSNAPHPVRQTALA